MSEPVPIKSFAELVELLRANQMQLEVDAAGQALAVGTPELQLGGKVLIRWELSFPFVQIIQPMIDEVPADRVRDVESAICRLNNVAKFAGLGYDDSARLIYYRVTMVILRDGIRSDLLQADLHGAVANAKELLAAMRAIVDGAPPERALELSGIKPPN